MQSKYSNSEIGSSHWFNTTMGEILHYGEYLKLRGTGGMNEESLKEWGEAIYGRALEHIENFKEVSQQAEYLHYLNIKQQYNQLKEKYDVS